MKVRILCQDDELIYAGKFPDLIVRRAFQSGVTDVHGIGKQIAEMIYQSVGQILIDQ